jgi:hypothetical protein
MRYRDALGAPASSPPEIFIDLNLPRGSSGPHGPEGLPAFMNLVHGVQSKKYALVFIDLEDGASFSMSALMFVRPHLEQAGAKVLNAFYDDEGILEKSLKGRYGKGAMVDDLTDGSDVVCFFPGLASEITACSLRKELRNQDFQRMNERIDALKRLKPYGGGRVPFIEDRLSSEWKEPR